MPAAVVTLAFDPSLRAGPFVVRWETLGLAAAIFVSLLLAAAFARASGRGSGLSRLRLDDLFFLAIVAVPGAVVGGRAVLALTHLDYYGTHPGALVDPAQGSLSLLGAVLGGTATAAYMARLLEVPARRWMDAVAVPLLVAIGLGKLAYLLGGGGQGAHWDGPWSLAFTGSGPWLSPFPELPAQPSQVYEAAWNLLGAAVVLVFSVRRARRRYAGPFRLESVSSGAPAQASVSPVSSSGDGVAGGLSFGSVYAIALAWFLAGRVLVGFTWADAPAVAGLNAEQVAALVVLVVLVLLGAATVLVNRVGRARGT